jgi:ribosomal protein S18 acetylase RimI-like enzyme
MDARDMIRDYEPAEHWDQVRSCVVELQEFERELEPSLPRGKDMADAYLTFLLDRCSQTGGRVLVAEVDHEVVGFVAVFARVVPEEPDEDQTPYAYISDLVVLPRYRRRDIGRALLEGAEAFVHSSGARVLRVGVLAKNEPAAKLYRVAGFSEYQLQLVKRLP